MSDQLVIRALPVGDVSLQGDGRSVVLRLLTYGREYQVSDDGVHEYVERWRPGAFKRSIIRGNSLNVPLSYEHDQPGTQRALPVGGSKRAWEENDALMLEGRISRTSVGDDLVELLRDGVIRGVSIVASVFQSTPFVGGFERREAQLRSVGFTTAPQYDDAELVTMRSEPDPPATPRLDAVKARMAIFDLA